MEFCNKLSEKQGFVSCYTIDGTTVTCDFSKNGYRLPTEAVWEYVAKERKNRGFFRFSGSDTAEEVGWYSDKTHPVGGKNPNALGLYDMSGNLSEWCWNWYGDYSEGYQINPRGPTGGSFRVCRGGFYGGNYLKLFLLTNRGYTSAEDAFKSIGF